MQARIYFNDESIYSNCTLYLQDCTADNLREILEEFFFENIVSNIKLTIHIFFMFDNKK